MLTTTDLKIVKCQNLDMVTALKINRQATADRALTMSIAENAELIFFTPEIKLSGFN